jgi:hypothetical protein
MADPGRIEVQLSLLSGQDTAAAHDLATALGQIGQMFTALRASDFRDSAEKMAQLHAKMVADTERFMEEGRATQVRGQGQGGRSTPQEAARQGVDLGQWMRNQQEERERQQREQQRLRQEKNEAEQRIKEALAAQDKSRQERQAQAEELRIEGLTPDQQRADQRRRSAGLPGIGTSEDDPNAWYNKVEPLRGEATGFRIPRFGELNIQDYLNMWRDKAQESALRNEPMTMFGRETNLDPSRQAEIAQRLSDRAGQLFAVRAALRWAGGRLSQENINPFQFGDIGAQLGYSRDSNPLSQFLGVQTPFSAAGQEGWRQARDSLRLRFQAGINNQQAQSIIQATSGAGFSGGLGEDIRMNLMAPLARRYGVNPQEIVPFLQTLRTGTATIADLNRVLGDMGEVARSANLTLSEYNRNLAGSVESTQALGGGAIRGAEFGRQFMMGTGLPSNVGDTLSQNPLIQAFVGAQTGVPAMAQGALSAGARMRGIRGAINTLQGAYAPAFSGLQRERTPIRDPDTNEVVGYETSGNLALGAVANRLGVSPDALSQMMKTEERQARVESFQTRARTYEQNVANATTNPRLMAERRRDLIGMAMDSDYADKFDLPQMGGGRESYRWQDGELQHRNASGDWKTIADRKKAHEMAQEWSSDRATTKTRDWHKLHDAATRLGVDKKELREAEQQDDPGKRLKAVRRLVSEASREAEAQYQIAMTPLTKKFFKVMASDQNVDVDWSADARNTRAATPPGPKQLSPRTNTGAGPVTTHGEP